MTYEATYFYRDGGWNYTYYPDNDHPVKPWSSYFTEKVLFESTESSEAKKKPSGRPEVMKAAEEIRSIVPEEEEL